MRVLALVLALICGAWASHPEGWRLIRVSSEIEFWASPEQINSLAIQDVGFVDVTDTHDLEQFGKERALARAKQSYPTSPLQGTLVRNLISEISMDNYNSTLTTFTSFVTRHCLSAMGVESASWLFDQAQMAAVGVGTVTTFTNPQFGQFNVIARIEGDGSDNNLVIVGAHQDSIAGGTNVLSPGADDDGSGSMMILELLRVIATGVRTGAIQLKRPIEFQWYAGEEIGLVGSRNQAADYAARGVPVYSMFQFDMIGYPSSPNTGVGVITDNTDPALTQFSRMLIDEYLTIGRTDSLCGYGCSDHASWTSAGYPAVFPFEAPFGQQNRFIHTSDDTIANGVDMARSEQFAHLGLSYLVEASLAP